MIKLRVSELPEKARLLRAGDFVLLTGDIICCRDAAHKRFAKLISENKPLPFEPEGAVIYYAGPTPPPPGKIIGSCGPTTSSRMDSFTPSLLSLGVIATIGKGKRSEKVVSAMKEYGAVYFCAVGGAGALACRCITESELIAFEDLGCEAVRRLRFRDFPLIVGISSDGETVIKA